MTKVKVFNFFVRPCPLVAKWESHTITIFAMFYCLPFVYRPFENRALILIPYTYYKDKHLETIQKLFVS